MAQRFLFAWFSAKVQMRQVQRPLPLPRPRPRPLPPRPRAMAAHLAAHSLASGPQTMLYEVSQTFRSVALTNVRPLISAWSASIDRLLVRLGRAQLELAAGKTLASRRNSSFGRRGVAEPCVRQFHNEEASNGREASRFPKVAWPTRRAPLRHHCALRSSDTQPGNRFKLPAQRAGRHRCDGKFKSGTAGE